MIEEVVRRRLSHKDFPDIFVVDGGRGQVSVFQKVIFEKKLQIPVLGIVKPKSKTGWGHLILPGRKSPYPLRESRGLFCLMAQMRDEAHRFSRKLHHKAEKKRLFN